MHNFPVYLVDDDDSVRRSVSFMLKTSGIRVQSFENGTDFLNEANQLEPGCVLLDIRMPGMDGLEVQDELVKLGVPLPVIVMTGHGDITNAVKAMKTGAIDFIEKPFEKSIILDAVENAFDQLDGSKRRKARREDALLRLNGLTPRERDVLDGLVAGYPNKTIGYDLGISSRTVEIHRANLMRKLEATSLSDLLRIAFAAGLGE